MATLLILASSLLVIVLAVILALLVPSRRRPRPPESPSHLSPDGNWWWDGTQWLPSGRTSLPPIKRLS